jgi:hypothetical protein
MQGGLRRFEGNFINLIIFNCECRNHISSVNVLSDVSSDTIDNDNVRYTKIQM